MRYNILDLNLATIWTYTAYQKFSLQDCVRRAISYKMLQSCFSNRKLY